MTLAAWFAAGAAVAFILWLALAPTWSNAVFTRQNYRGRDVPTAGGTAAVLAVLFVASAAAVVRETGMQAKISATLIAVIGFGLLGLLDDLTGDDDRKGFRGHVGALARGRLTTGGLKLVGGVAVAAAALGVAGQAEPVDIVIVAAAANLGNLLDRAPGRVTKIALICLAGLLATGEHALLAGTALAVGAAAGLAPFDLRERLMLGDSGANAVGAALGLGLVLVTDAGAALAAAAVLVALNLVSELVSFSRVIAAVPPLRWFDALGRVRGAA